MKGPREGVGFLVPVVAFVALFALLPVALLFANALVQVGGTSGFLSVVTTARNLRSLDNSLEQGALSATLAVGLGYPAGVFVGRYSFRGRSLLRSLLLVPFLLPSLVVVLGVLDLFGPSGVISTVLPFTAWFGSGIPAIIAANLFFNVPIVLLLTATGCEGASVELEETVATLGGSPLRAYGEVWARPTWVGAAAGGLLTFLFSALSFAPPLLLCGASSRCYTLEAQVYALDQTFLEPNAAAVLALAMVLLLLLPTAGYLALVSRLRASPGRRTAGPRPIDWRAPATWALALETGLVLATEATLLAAVLYRTVAPSGRFGAGAAWAQLFSASTTAHLGVSAFGAIANTLFFAVVAALLALLLCVASGYAVVRRPDRAVALGLLLFVPLLLSPVVLAFALSSFWRPSLSPSRASRSRSQVSPGPPGTPRERSGRPRSGPSWMRTCRGSRTGSSRWGCSPSPSAWASSPPPTSSSRPSSRPSRSRSTRSPRSASSPSRMPRRGCSSCSVSPSLR
jgi:thiamine transport system permease protein